MRAKLHAGEKLVISKRNETSFWSGMSVAWWGPGDIGLAEALFSTPENIQIRKQGTWLPGAFYATNQRIIFEGENVDKNKIIPLEKVDSFNLLSDCIEILEENGTEQRFYLPKPSVLLKHLEALLQNCILQKARHCEEVLDYEKAIKLWGKIGRHEDAKRVREKVINGQNRTVVHGDYIDDRDTTYIDDRDTIVKDSVVSKSSIGSSSSKLQEIKELKELHDAGAIDDDEFKQMKKEILGK